MASGRPVRYMLASRGKPIVARMREHAELTLDDFREVIAAKLIAPWWRHRDQAPAPGILFGSARRFESAFVMREQHGWLAELLARREWRSASRVPSAADATGCGK